MNFWVKTMIVTTRHPKRRGSQQNWGRVSTHMNILTIADQNPRVMVHIITAGVTRRWFRWIPLVPQVLIHPDYKSSTIHFPETCFFSGWFDTLHNEWNITNHQCDVTDSIFAESDPHMSLLGFCSLSLVTGTLMQRVWTRDECSAISILPKLNASCFVAPLRQLQMWRHS